MKAWLAHRLRWWSYGLERLVWVPVDDGATDTVVLRRRRPVVFRNTSELAILCTRLRENPSGVSAVTLASGSVRDVGSDYEQAALEIARGNREDARWLQISGEHNQGAWIVLLSNKPGALCQISGTFLNGLHRNQIRDLVEAHTRPATWAERRSGAPLVRPIDPESAYVQELQAATARRSALIGGLFGLAGGFVGAAIAALTGVGG